MINKITFWLTSKRIGPDIPLTHWLLHSRRLGQWLCRKKFAQFGQNSEMRHGSYAVCTDYISIGKNVVIRPSSMLFASSHGASDCNIIIEDYVLMGSGVHIYTANHCFSDPSVAIYFQGHEGVKPVTILSGAWLGANAIVLPGVTIGRNSVVGAGSVVTKDVPDNTVVAGQPAKFIKRIEHSSC
ncbi:acyltransferase [Shewanella gaetbuli]|uniref:acyltransferase n=1 Tax=Shewanella gaetbuli TaxID=220752 RepID=UPI0023E01777|nr:acyltransferase [Shewanella gaetbuli]